jgi:translation elongation factor EF-G
MTQGGANYTMQYSHYEPVPATVAEGIIAKFDGKSDDDA